MRGGMRGKMKALQISENGRFLQTEDGEPFFWLGDTAWELFHRLSREDADFYLKNRAALGYNVIQAVALAEFGGLRVPNAYGRVPLLQNDAGEYDPAMPDLTVTETDSYTYWDHVDYVIGRAEEFGLYIGLLPTWGDKYNLCWGEGPEIFNGENAYRYGKWIGERYQDRKNIVWILGGDRRLSSAKHFDVIRGMARGIREADKGTHLMTFHPNGGLSSSFHVHEEEWLDFNMLQSGHDCPNKDNYSMIKADYERIPVKPVLDGEPRYEDHGINFREDNGYYDAADVRQAAYWAVFAGGFGHTYGHHCIWGMCTEPGSYHIMTWKDALQRPGGVQMQYLKKLMESRPFLERVPDQGLIAGYGEDGQPDPEEKRIPIYGGANHQQATRGRDYAFLYTPNGLPLHVRMGKITGEQVTASWFNPRTGEETCIGCFANQGTVTFVPPSCGRGNDWVLMLDDRI